MDDTTQYCLTHRLSAICQLMAAQAQPRDSELAAETMQARAMLQGIPQLQESIALTRIWAHLEQLTQTVVREKALTQGIARIRQTLDRDTIVRTTTQEVRQLLNCDRAVVYRFCPNWRVEVASESVASGWVSLKKTDLQRGWRDTELQATRGGKYRNHEHSVVNDIYRANLSDSHLDGLEKLQIRAYLIIPVFVDKKLWGLLAAHQNSGPRVWKQQELSLLSQVGTHLGVALQQAHLLSQQQQAKQKAEGCEPGKSHCLALISHELRTPLNAILGFSQVLMRDPQLSPNQREQLGAIAGSGEHLLALLGDILDLSKVEAGGAVLKAENFDLYGALNQLKDLFQEKAIAKGLQLIIDYDANVPRYICADQGKLRQVLINLISNAIKFTQTGQIIVRVNVDDSWQGDRGVSSGLQEAGQLSESARLLSPVPYPLSPVPCPLSPTPILCVHSLLLKWKTLAQELHRRNYRGSFSRLCRQRRDCDRRKVRVRSGHQPEIA